MWETRIGVLPQVRPSLIATLSSGSSVAGGMGVVWLAQDEKLERDVALKFFPELVIYDPAVLEELKRETKRSLALTHHGIVRIHDFVQGGESACISMEYVDGPTLSALRVQRPTKVFEPEELAPWMKQLCEALGYAHERAQVVHRDLKPANIMLNSRGEVKVTDFGIARSVSDSMSMVSAAHRASGTLVYMSPQQLDGERTSPVDDIYSLGATLYELLTGKPPFYSGNIDRQIREKIAPLIGFRRKELSVQSDALIPWTTGSATLNRPKASSDTNSICPNSNPAIFLRSSLGTANIY
jgi:serine/threonine protein kinase